MQTKGKLDSKYCPHRIRKTLSPEIFCIYFPKKLCELVIEKLSEWQIITAPSLSKLKRPKMPEGSKWSWWTFGHHISSAVSSDFS